MRKFTITEMRLAETRWTYKVEAETEADALEMVFTGEVQHENYEVRDLGGESEFDVDEKENDIDGMVDGQYIVTIDKK